MRAARKSWNRLSLLHDRMEFQPRQALLRERRGVSHSLETTAHLGPWRSSRKEPIIRGQMPLAVPGPTRKHGLR